MTAPTLRFSPPAKSSFARDVRAEVAAYFSSRGLSDKGNATIHLRTVAMLAMTFVPYGLLLGGVGPPAFGLVYCVLIGVGLAGG